MNINEMINKRHEISVNYCKSKSWDTNLTTLTLEQILEIKEQPEWKKLIQSELK